MNRIAEPEDVAALKARLAVAEAALAEIATALVERDAAIAESAATLAEREAALADLAEANRRLEQMIDDLRREKFGARSEKLSPDQYNLPLEDVEIAQGILEAA